MCAHHENGPSSLYRRQNCPASMLAERGIIEEESEDAAEGTMLHQCVVDAYSDATLPDLNDEQLDAVGKCVKFLKEYDGIGEPWMLESGLKLFDKQWEVITFGTADAVKIVPDDDLAILADWKFGRNPVSSPAMNMQFAAYAAMIMQEFGVSRVECHLVQPRLFSEPEPFAYTNLNGIVKTITGVISGCLSPGAKRIPGDHCNYCKAKNSCSAFNEYSTSVVSLQECAICADNAADIASTISQVRKQCDRATEMLKTAVCDAGGRLGNLVLNERRGGREASSKGLYADVMDVISADEFMALTKPSIAGIEGLYASRMKESAGTKKRAKALFNELPSISRKKKLICTTNSEGLKTMLKREEISENKQMITGLLIETNRTGIERLIDWLDSSKFFTCPASTKYHSAYKGGLAQHSINVWHEYVKLAQEHAVEIAGDSVAIACLLHDVCKVGAYSGASAPYKFIGSYEHARLSLKRIERFIRLKDVERKMIKYHMGIYGATNNNSHRNEYSIIGLKDALNDKRVKLMCFADELATIKEKAL